MSLNAVANLGYADGRFLRPVHPGDTLLASSEVIGLKENRNGETGIVYVRTTGTDADGVPVLTYCRWVMVRKRDPGAPAIRRAPAPSRPRRDRVHAPGVVRKRINIASSKMSPRG